MLQSQAAAVGARAERARVEALMTPAGIVLPSRVGAVALAMQEGTKQNYNFSPLVSSDEVSLGI